jgi:two-component system, response regulator YesN
MKAIIIDDEKHVREGLILLADWEDHGITTILEAEDGDEAIELIKEHRPEIIFTDMHMPKRDGISLLRWLHSSEFRCKTIVVSGYDDFQYVRNALLYKSFDYILKPIEPDILNETLSKAVSEWNEQALFRKSQAEEIQVLNEVKPLYWDRLFSILCHTGDVSSSGKKKITNEFGISISEKEKQAALVNINPIVLKAFQADEELAFFTLSNICNELLRKGNDGVCFRNINSDEELVILLWNEVNASFLLQEIYSIIYQYCKIKPIIALGEKSVNLKEAYESARQVLKKHNLLTQKKIVTTADLSTKPHLHLLDFSNELKWAVRSGSTSEVETQLAKLFDLLEKKFILTLEQAASWDSQFNLLKNNWLKEYEIDNNTVFYQGTDFWNDDGSFSFKKFRAEKQREFKELIKALTDAKYQKEKNSMQKIEEYLQQHYQEDITLQEMAERFFLSREYISRKFKQEYRETITDYLTNIRMDKAKKLLENPFLKIYEIAYGVGFQNEKYFSKVFKKHEGLTPNEYRQTLSAKS